MSNSHPLCSLFTMFKPATHQFLPVIVVAMVPWFFPTVLEAVHFNCGLHVHTHVFESQCRPPLLEVAGDSCKNNNNRIGWMPKTPSAWWKICGSSKAMENLWEALQFRRLRHHKAGRGEATPQYEATKKTVFKVKSTRHL